MCMDGYFLKMEGAWLYLKVNIAKVIYKAKSFRLRYKIPG